MISDPMLSGLTSSGVSWLNVYRSYEDRGLYIISDRGILDFCRGTSNRNGSRRLVLPNVQNCGTVVARLLQVSH